MYNYLYKKEALDLYMFLFHNKSIGDINKDKIKNILYVSYCYISLNLNDIKIEKVIDYFSHIESIEYLDNLMLSDNKIKKYYIFYPIHNDLTNEETKKRYIEGLKLIKEELNKLNISEYGIYLKTKEDIYNLLEKSLNKELSLEDQINENDFFEKIEILSKYVDKNDIEIFKSCINKNTNKEKNALQKRLMYIFDNKIYNIREIELIKDLKYKTSYSNKIKKHKLDLIKLNKKELSNLRQIILKNIIINSIFLLLLSIFGYKCYLLFFDKYIETVQNYKSLLMILIIMFISVPIITLIKDIIKLIFLKKKNKGQVGFINKILYNYHGEKKSNDKCYYSIYLPKDNESYVINSKYCEKDLNVKDLIMLIKIFNDFYLIKCDESRFLKGKSDL